MIIDAGARCCRFLDNPLFTPSCATARSEQVSNHFRSGESCINMGDWALGKMGARIWCKGQWGNGAAQNLKKIEEYYQTHS